MFKILPARPQQYLKQELPDVQAGFGKAEEPEIKLPTSVGSYRKQGNSKRKKKIHPLHYIQKLTTSGSVFN